MGKADVIIVGAGVVGASTALAMSRAGYNVTVVDKAGGPGHGSTSASSAVVRYNYSTWDGIASAWESKFRWEQWEEFLGYQDPSGLAQFVRCGLAFLDVEAISGTKMCSLFNRAGIPYEEWSAQQLSRAVPGIDVGRYYPPKPVTSEEFFDDPHGQLGAIFTPDAGYVDDPQLAASNLARAAEHNGTKLMFKRSVTALRRVSRLWQVELDRADVLEAPIVVNAAGPWSTILNRLAGVGSEFTVQVAPMRQEVHHVAMPEGLRRLGGGAVPILADADLGTYIRADADHSLLIGGTEPECDPLEWITDPDEAEPSPTAERFEAQVYRGARRLPELHVPNRPRGIAGVYDTASDWTPIYDRTDEDGFYVAMGTSGNQFKNAPLIGDLMRAIITSVESGTDHDADPVRYVAPHTGHTINLGSFSRRRPRNEESSGTVFG